jgi:hypothetical protein
MVRFSHIQRRASVARTRAARDAQASSAFDAWTAWLAGSTSATSLKERSPGRLTGDYRTKVQLIA